MALTILKPYALQEGSTIGVFTPSSPGYKINHELFENGLKTLQRLGFNIKLGTLTARRGSQGYRSGTPRERAQEFMELIVDPDVHGLMATIGGSNSSSLIPYLNFDEIRKQRKLICGFSDLTSLHLAVLKHAGLRTLYGPSVMCWFGDWQGVPESSDWFLEAAVRHRSGERMVIAPSRWSNHQRRWDNGDWKCEPRDWQVNEGWRVLNPGHTCAPILALNLNTLMSTAGTPYWPDLGGKILLIEDMEATMSRTERHLRQLEAMKVFDKISGLIVGKPEVFKSEEATFSYEDLFREIVGPRPYPIISNFDCSHCVPMISIPQMTMTDLFASHDQQPVFRLLEPGVTA